MFKKVILIFMLGIYSTIANADVACTGKIKELVKWSENHTYDLSILLEGTNRYIQFKDTISKSLILTAFASQKTVRIKWVSDNITSCTDGWPHYAELDGYMSVTP
jgi:hypothetical protein